MLPITQSAAGMIAFYQSLSAQQKLILSQALETGVFPVLAGMNKLSPALADVVQSKVPLEQKLVACVSEVPMVKSLITGESTALSVEIECPCCNSTFYKEV